MKRLPIGIQTFRDIRDPKENYVYIDKTDIAYRLIDSGKYYFLSRPRRFGKSLFLDTLSELFKGSEELFRGLAIHDKWDWTQKYPVVKISFGSGDFSTGENLASSIQSILAKNIKTHSLDKESCWDFNPGFVLKNIIEQLHEKHNQKVVILIDEYDKPILDVITDAEKSKASREVLRSFYGVLKDSDEYLRFVFMTGVSKFSKLNLFSGLNNLTDITIDEAYGTITGYTHADLLNCFDGWFDGVDMEEVRRWYNGYNYFAEPIYNPFDVLQFLSKGKKFRNYWWETGNPSFLVELLKKQPRFLPDLENVVVSETTLGAFDIEYIDLCALLWQTGYLTFDTSAHDLPMNFYKLRVPNLEIQSSLNALFLDYLTNLRSGIATNHVNAFRAFRDADVTAIKMQLSALFAAISHHNYTNNTLASFEGYYASVMFAFLASLGFDIVAEDTTNKGRIDMTLKTAAAIYIFEFKVDMPAEAALEQCHTKRYHEKYLADGRPITLIGIHFDSKERNIVGFETETIAD